MGGCFGGLSERREAGQMSGGLKAKGERLKAKGEGLRPCGLYLSIKAMNILKHKNRLNRGDNYGNKSDIRRRHFEALREDSVRRKRGDMDRDKKNAE